MEKMTFGCWGHAFNRSLSYTDKNGRYNEFTLPGGAALIQQLLSAGELTRYEPLDKTVRCERFELKQFEDKQTRKSYYTVNRYLGFTEGSTTPLSCDAKYAIVFDKGLGLITLPPENIPVLWASDKNLPEKEIVGRMAERCFLMLDANVLRNSGAMISARISWERSVTELLWQLQNNPALSCLCKAPHILITFAEDGAVYIRRENNKTKASLVLAHGNGEGFLRGKINNSINDSFALMTVGLALQFPEVIGGKKTLQILPVLKAAENLLTNGYPLEKLREGKLDMPEIETDMNEMPFEIPFDPEQNVVDPDFWRISNSASNKRIFDMACEYVLKGAKVIEGLPLLSFGGLTTIDRWEIEAFRNICNLIENYVGSDSVRPLSIAVFGAPGSGKSFGVTQIAKNILPGKVERLEFNVSQFVDNADIGIAFQKVRDVTLEGKLPLVFFDEFDSDRNGIQLGWVKNFLMPMQDGKFKDASGEHPLGKCILVFAGGTSSSFEEFARPMSSENPEEQKKFKDIKGPDFVSRLRGTINVLGPNQTGANDKNYILRRALLLRSLCERKLNMKKGGEAPLNKNILWAMLLVPKYKHGARSMEAIMDMSRIEGNVWEPVSLPFYSQLSLHVDADAFIRLVLREVILNGYQEKLAIAIHEDFCRKNPTSDNNIPWEELPEDIKDSNRDQARCFGRYLDITDYDYDSGDTPFLSVEKFSEDEILKIAKLAHEIWIKSKIDAGWTYGDRKDAVKRTHPLLVDWDDLPETEKQKDKDIAENIIPMMRSVGLRIYKAV
ncbi:MAG: AAA family ATPase [Tannerella sp.]|jgi:hypothetical protein|nr:AAA family ATPase [Tannerella sp.]